MFIIFIGVAGAGKTTVGKLLAKELGGRFYEADDFHSVANIEKMRRATAPEWQRFCNRVSGFPCGLLKLCKNAAARLLRRSLSGHEHGLEGHYPVKY